MKDIIEALEQQGRGAKFISVTYTSKKHKETARYTLQTGVNYVEACEKDILECELQLKEATGIKRIVLESMIASLKESIAAKNEGREHKDYTKAGLYRSICPGVQLNLNDNTLEIKGFQHAKKVLVAGEYKKVNSRPETIVKNEIRKGLRTGKFKTLCLDFGNIHSAKINGDTIEIE